MRVLNGGKSNKCDRCKFSTAQTANLKNHMKVHSGGKSNKCDHCKSQHLKTVNLNAHMKVHSGGNLTSVTSASLNIPKQ